MPAWETARTWWEEHSATPFEERVGWHLSCGLVYSSPTAFLLASEVCWNGMEILHGPPNAWFIELAVCQGAPLSLFMRIAPHPHDWVLFRRNNGFTIRAYRWDRLSRLLKFPPTRIS